MANLNDLYVDPANESKFADLVRVLNGGYFAWIKLYDRYGFARFDYELNWLEKPNDSRTYGLEINIVSREAYWFCAIPKHGYRHPMTFEEIFELIPEYIQIDILFHLDLFNFD